MRDLTTLKPSWATHLIVAEYEVDTSDMMSDYFATRTERTVVLAWSRHGRDLFSELRTAAARFPETAALATAPKDAEHREKYSMGHGYYLKASGRYSTGWTVRKVVPSWHFSGSDDALDTSLLTAPAPAATVDLVALATRIEAPTTGPAPPAATAPTVALNALKNGVELTFPAKPDVGTRDTLKAHGWRWSRFGGLWYTKDTPTARAFAEALTGGPLGTR